MYDIKINCFYKTSQVITWNKTIVWSFLHLLETMQVNLNN